MHRSTDTHESGAGTGKLIAPIVVCLLGIGGAAYWFYGRAPEPEPEPAAPPPVVEREEPPPEPAEREEDLPSTGALVVRANVEGALVFLDGNAVGAAPYDNPDIRIGRYAVKVTKEGYRDFVENVRIRPGRREALTVTLDVLPPSLRIDSDVAGATVFLDRNYVGTTPVDLQEVTAGQHELTVSAEGYDMYAETISVGSGHTDVRVDFRQVASELHETIAVVHKHGFGDCQGRLVADSNGIRYETDHQDAFSAPYASLETFEIDYIDKNLNLKVVNGRNYNFTEIEGDADALFVFHRNVQEFLESM